MDLPTNTYSPPVLGIAIVNNPYIIAIARLAGITIRALIGNCAPGNKPAANGNSTKANKKPIKTTFKRTASIPEMFFTKPDAVLKKTLSSPIIFPHFF